MPIKYKKSIMDIDEELDNDIMLDLKDLNINCKENAREWKLIKQWK